MTASILEMHHGIAVVRDDLFPGGTKARFIAQVFDGAQDAVYASPPEVGAQTAIATVARSLNKRATIFVAARTRPHPRTLEAARLGAKVVPITPADVYFGRGETIPAERRRIKQQTIQNRRLNHQRQAA